MIRWNSRRRGAAAGLVLTVTMAGVVAVPASQVGAAQGTGATAETAIDASGAQLRVSVVVDAASFDGADPVGLTVTVTNTDSEPVAILVTDTPLEGLESDLFDVTSNGRSIDYVGKLLKRGAPTEPDYVVLDPGESSDAHLDLTDGYAIGDAGAYVADLGFTIGDVRTGPSPLTGLGAGASTAVTVAVPPVGFELTADRAPAGSPGSGGSGASFTNCTATEQTAITTAFPAALTMLADSVDVLATAASPATAPRYLEWFGAHTSQRYATVQSHFTAIDSHFRTNTVSGLPWSCNVGCPANTYAYVFPTDTTFRIFLCSGFFGAATSGTDSRAGTMIHEASHFVSLGDTDDNAYGQTAARALAISNPTAAVANADSHEYFAENTPALSMGPRNDVAPAAPTNLVLATSGANVNVSWTDNATNETGFEVQRARWVVGQWTEFVTLPSVAANTTSTVDSNVTAGFYAYLVRAVNGTGNSEWLINVIQHSTATVVPPAPTNLVPTNSGSNVNLTWTDTASDEYVQEIGRARFNFTTKTWGEWTFLLADRNATTFTDVNVPDGQYAYLVRSVNRVGPSPWVITVITHVNIPGVPAAPSGVGATTTVGIVLVSWFDNADNEVVYEVQRAKFVSGTWTNWTTFVFDKNSGSFSDSPGPGQHAYLVRATNPTGSSNWVTAVVNV